MQIVNSKPFIEKYFKIYNEDKVLVPFVLWPKQGEAYDLLHSSLACLYLKSRQSGFSTLTGADSIAQCMFQDDFVVVVLSITGDDAEEYLQRAWDLYEKMDDEQKMFFPLAKNGKKVDEIVFANGSRLLSLPAKRGSGFTADRVIIDEFFKINPTRSSITINEVMTNVSSVIDKRKGQLVLLGTAAGMNEQQELWEKSSRGQTEYKTLFFSCWDDPTMENEEQRQKKANLLPDPTTINQDYPRTAEEAFLSSGRPRFDLEKLMRIPEYIPLMDIKFSSIPDIEFYETIKPDGNYAVICDVAEGLEKHDESTLEVEDRMTGETVAQWSGHVEPHVLGDMAVAVARHCNDALIIVERNNHGLATLTQIIQVHKYPEERIFRHDIFKIDDADKQLLSPAKRFGWLTTPGRTGTRQQIIDSLGNAVFNETIKRLTKKTKAQMMKFVIKKSGKVEGEGTYLDDLVITAAIKQYLLEEMAELTNSFYPLEYKPIIEKKTLVQQHVEQMAQTNIQRHEIKVQEHEDYGGVDMGVMYDEF